MLRGYFYILMELVFTKSDVIKNEVRCRKNSAASNFYEMRRNLNFMARNLNYVRHRFGENYSDLIL